MQEAGEMVGGERDSISACETKRGGGGGGACVCVCLTVIILIA